MKMLITFVLVAAAGVFIYMYFTGQTTAPSPANVIETVQDAVTQNNTAATNTSDMAAPKTSTQIQEPITINISNLPESQRAILKTMGYSGPTITVTAEMVACAEAKVGTARVAEYRAGATPSGMEAISLVACL